MVLRLLLENVVRCMHGTEREQAVAALLSWLDHGSSEAEIEFQPARVLMHDTTSTPALVDIAAMRDALAEAGVDPSRLNPVLPVDVSVDHSLAVEAYGQRDASAINLTHEMRRNRERYAFLRWASKALQGVHINPPGTGIMHTINLEQLATVVTTEARDGSTWFVPDMMIGTDSHTPMINGIGVLGWGVGGLEAQTVMFGMPTMLRIPDVIGVQLDGALRPGALATDLALTVTQRLREIGVAGEFVEFFGPGVATLSAGERSVVANMAPEYGATTGFFAVDSRTLDYLRETGRDAAQVALVEAYAQRTGLWFDPAARPRYSRTIAIDLPSIGMHIAGPRRPQDLLRYSEARSTLAALAFEPGSARPVPAASSDRDRGHHELHEYLRSGAARRGRAGRAQGPAIRPPRPDLGQDVARPRARRRPLPTCSAPGSSTTCPPSASTSSAYGCTTCIGNSGPSAGRDPCRAQRGLDPPGGGVVGQSQFPRPYSSRYGPGLPDVAAAGDRVRARRQCRGRPEPDPIQVNAGARAVHLSDLWPTREEVAPFLPRRPTRPTSAGVRLASRNPLWHALDAPDSPRFPWSPTRPHCGGRRSPRSRKAASSAAMRPIRC